jgi:Glycosyltransferase Family 4
MATETINKKKLLIISWTLHPWPTGSSIIVNNLAENMNRDDVVLVGEKHPTLASAWPDDLPKIYYVDPNVKIRGRGQTHLRWLNFFRTKAQLLAICKKERVDKILIIFPDDFYLSLAYSLSKTLNIPLFSWFHNTYLDNYTGYRKYIASILQPLVFKHSSKVFVMSDGMKKYYDQKYPEYHFETLVHGFKLPDKQHTGKSNTASKGVIKFLFTGSLNESCRDATIRMMKVILAHPDYELHIYTGNPRSDFEKYGIVGERLFYHGFIALSQLYIKMKEFDIMLLPHGFMGDRTDVEFKTIFPTRTIPLLVSGKPILAHTPKGVFLTDFLEKNNCAFVVGEPSDELIRFTIKGILENPLQVEEKVKNALKISKIFEVDMVCNQLKSTIEFDS